LFSGVYRDLYVHIVRRVGPDSADDVLADTFTSLWVRWPVVPASMAERRARTFGIARHRLGEESRARHRRARLAARLAGQRPREVPPVDNATITDQRVDDLLAQLHPCERDAFELSVIAGLTSAEVAGVLGCSPSAVTSNVYRARKRLERHLTLEAKESAGSARPKMGDQGGGQR
jgi:RNA polymerase sigma-70 factor (ECF subfamily)